MEPNALLSEQFRLAEPQREALRKLGIRTVLDALYHFPSRYDEAGNEESIAGLEPRQEATIFGTIKKLETRRSWKRKVLWFHQPYLAKKFSEGMFV